MQLNLFGIQNMTIAEEISGEVVVSDLPEALDFVGNAYYQGAEAVIVRAENLGPDFFKLETGLAGELLQKFANYGMKLAIIGGFEKYQSKSLDALIRECNRGSQVFFVPDRESALSRLTG